MARKRKGHDTWHFCSNCSNSPTRDYITGPGTSGEKSNECMAKQRAGTCRTGGGRCSLSGCWPGWLHAASRLISRGPQGRAGAAGSRVSLGAAGTMEPPRPSAGVGQRRLSGRPWQDSNLRHLPPACGTVCAATRNYGVDVQRVLSGGCRMLSLFVVGTRGHVPRACPQCAGRIRRRHRTDS